MASFELKKDELKELGVTVIAATSDDMKSTVKMADEYGLTMPIAYGVTGNQVTGFDPWHGDNEDGQYIQPMEFLINRGGTVDASMYASGPIGRMASEEALIGLKYLVNQ